MSAEARYFRVGVFVFAGMALTVVCIIALGGRGLFERHRIFETYFDESVQGLEVGSPVKFKGVQIGEVTEIGIALQFYDLPPERRLEEGENILVRMKIVPAAEGEPMPVEALLAQGLRARLTQQGITGVAYIELDFKGPDAPPPMEFPWEPEYPYIPSMPSMMSTITSAAERIFERLEAVDVEGIVEHLDELVVNVDDAVEALDVGALQGDIAALLDDLREAVVSAKGALDGAKGTLVRTERLVDGSRYDIEQSLENLRVTTENLRELTDTLRNQPSLLLRSGAPEETAP